jgi:hypothetical protein
MSSEYFQPRNRSKATATMMGDMDSGMIGEMEATPLEDDE